MSKSSSKFKVQRRKFLKQTAALGAVAVAGGVAAPFVRSAEAKKIRFLNVETIAGAKEILLKSAADYKTLTGVEVEIDTNSLDQTWVKLQASIRAGKPYELYMDGFIGHVALLAAQGAIVPLTHITNKYKWGRNILFPIGGEVYWYPYDYNFASLHYNKDQYAQNGFRPARTHADFLKINKAFTDGKGKFGSIFPIESGASTNWETTGFFWAEDVRVFDDKWNVIIDREDMRPRVQRVLDFMAELAAYMPKDIAQASWATGSQGFVAGNNSHFSFVPIPIENAILQNTPLKGKIGLTTYPSSDGKNVGMCHGYDGISVTKSANTEEALKFLEWFADNGYVDFIVNRPLFFQPPRLDIYDNPKYKNSPIVKAAPDVVEFLHGLITKNDVIIRSIDTEGPVISEKAAKVFQSWAFSTMLQERILKKTPASRCVEIGAKIMRDVIA